MLDRVERFADDRRVCRPVAGMAMQQRPNEVAVLEDGPSQPGRLGQVERALQRARGARVLGQGVERQRIEQPRLGARRHRASALPRGPAVALEVRGERVAGGVGLAFPQAQPGDGIGHRNRCRGLALGTLEQRPARFGLAQRCTQQRLLGEQLIVQGGEQRPVADLLARGLQDAEGSLRVAAVSQQERAIEGMHRAQRAIARGVQRL
ncbi:MAG: hypothetical protein ACXWZZ_12930 [Solirubrobacteraceae bacterium]